MYLTILLSLITTLVMIYRLRLAEGKKPKELAANDEIVGETLLIGFGALLVSSVFISFFLPSKLVVETHELVAMSTGSQMRGSFVIGSGSFDSQMEYTVYVKNNDGSVSPMVIPAQAKVSIIEDEHLSVVGYWRHSAKKFDTTSVIAKWTLAANTDSDVELISNVLIVPVGTVFYSFSPR